MVRENVQMELYRVWISVVAFLAGAEPQQDREDTCHYVAHA
jgi:hypothetical protein